MPVAGSRPYIFQYSLKGPRSRPLWPYIISGNSAYMLGFLYTGVIHPLQFIKSTHDFLPADWNWPSYRGDWGEFTKERSHGRCSFNRTRSFLYLSACFCCYRFHSLWPGWIKSACQSEVGAGSVPRGYTRFTERISSDIAYVRLKLPW